MPSLGRRIFYTMRSEGAGAVREAIAIGLGMFIGCLPLFGLHLGLCLAIGWALRLNRLKMYLAANVSNPVMAPLLVFSELQLGSFLRRGSVHAISIQTVRTLDLRTFGGDLAVGSVAVGLLLGTIVGMLTFVSMRGSGRGDPVFFDLARAASDRYVSASITAWEFARSKLRGDPLYRTVVCGRLLPGGESLLDVGCGSGLMLALLAEARALAIAGRWPQHLGTAPIYRHMTGIDIRPSVVRIAREALGKDAEILAGDAGQLPLRSTDAVLICDVLHMVPFDEQERLLDAARRSLRTGGVIVIREADADAGWRFLTVRVGNRLKAVMLGHWRQRFHFRSQAGWRNLFATHGFAIAALPNGEGTPFASILFHLTELPVASATDRTPVHAG